MSYSEDRQNRRRAAQVHPMLIVMVVPLAAACMLGLPLRAQAHPGGDYQQQRGENVIVDQRARRAIETLQEAAPHDPPRHLCPWRAAPKTPAVGLAACPAQQLRFSLSRLDRGQAPTDQIPDSFHPNTQPQRGPPARDDIS